jgi:uncharacterized protein YjbI with pentapeptide repeats
MGNSTPQDSPQDRANEARSKHPEQTGSNAANLPEQDFLETEEELNLDDIDWSMLTDLSTKITSLDTTSGKESDTSANASSLDLDLSDWTEGGNEPDTSLVEMLELEGFDDFGDELGDLEDELGLGNVEDDFLDRESSFNDIDLDPFEDREYNSELPQSLSGTESPASGESDREFDDMADMTVVNVNTEIPIASSNKFESADLYNPIDKSGELGELGKFAELVEEAPINREIASNEAVGWNLDEQDLQEGLANRSDSMIGDDESGWSDDAISYGANSVDVPDYYADEVEPEGFNPKVVQTPNQSLMSNFDEDISDELFNELIAPQDIPSFQAQDIAATSSDLAQSENSWDFPNVPEPESRTAEINRDFSDLDAADEEFSDSTRIENDASRSLEGGDLSSERYSAAWEQELSSSYYSETTEQVEDESFNLAADEDWAPEIEERENLNLSSQDIEDVFGDSRNLDLASADDTNINRSVSSPEVPQILPLPSLPSLPSLPPLPPLPSQDSSRRSQTSRSDRQQSRADTKSERGFEEFDLPDFEWSETVSPRSGNNTGLRKDGSSNPSHNPPSPKAGPFPGTTEYKNALSENLSSDMSWSEILDRQPDISTDPLKNVPGRKPIDSSSQAKRSNFAPPDLRQSRSPSQSLANDIPVDRVDRVGQMGAFADNTDFNSPDFAAMAESMGGDEMISAEPVRPRRPRINIPELWEQYRGNLKIPAIALGAIAAIFGFFSIPPIKRFTVETGLRIGFNKDASGQDLTGVNFKGSNLEKANFTNANLTNANLESVNLKNAILIGTKLDSANLQKADLKGARFVGASLVQTNLASAALNLADLSDANLTKANLSKANMSGARLKGSKIESAKIDPEDKLMWQIVNEPKANRNLAGINMTGFNLSAAKLQAATLTDAKLTWADLSKSDLSNAKLDGTDLSGANLQGANLKGASLARSKWTKERVPKTDDRTICPNGANGPCKL